MCKVHIQRVDTCYECGICHVSMCPAPCFQIYHTLHGHLFDDPSRNGPKTQKNANDRGLGLVGPANEENQIKESSINAGHQGVTLDQFKEKLVRQIIGGNSFRRDSMESARTGI
ncbi:PiggyBac transposable element-derived 4 [Desmophyllum pertusum]|uniref:PiggyBac transposable element-derived 4 n=1 Tax=Desmophyllum pertusum TaxID=174260 RepID=A0A9W9YT38_9CNID|nr:PiggyBac transposable element-derived 4 [Desmophyllum pertusum]